MFWSVLFNVCLASNHRVCEWYEFSLRGTTEERTCAKHALKRLTRMFPTEGKYTLGTWYCQPKNQRINVSEVIK